MDSNNCGFCTPCAEGDYEHCETFEKTNNTQELAKLVLDWWEDHQYDTDDSGEYNTYSRDPAFVMKAKEIMGIAK